MTQTDPQLDYIRMLFKHEIAISKFYEACEEQFPDHSDLWSRLKIEEMEHAIAISKLFAKVKEGSLILDEGRFKKQALLTSLEHLTRLCSEIRSRRVSLTKAISLARDLEYALLERKYFEIFNSDSIELQQVFLLLQHETQKHLNMVEEALAQILQQSDSEMTKHQARG